MSEQGQSVPAEAVAVLRNFLDAAERKDEAGMRACLSRKTLEAGGFNNAGPEGVTFALGEPVVEGEIVVIPVKGTPKVAEGETAPADAPVVMELPAIIVKEEGAWKFDLVASMERMMGGSMEAAMDQVAEAMKGAVEHIGEAFAEGMSAAFGGESEEVPNWDDASPMPMEEECLPMPEMVVLPKTDEAVSVAVGTPVHVEAAIKDLLRQMGSTEFDGLVKWFEESLFSPWGEVMAGAVVGIPVAGRLRAVRLESASRTEHRFVALEGSDLVYRFYLNDDTNGFYGNDELLTMLPAILAGLPEHVSFNGYRLLANEEEYPNLETYKTRVARNYMRRISELLGKPIALEADWDSAHDAGTTTRELQRWGLNRVWGAIAYCCLDEGMKALLSGELKKIKFRLSYLPNDKYAVFKDGTLEIGLKYFLGEKGCFYEHEIAGVLRGEAINPEGANELEDSSEGGEPSQYEEMNSEPASAAPVNAEAEARNAELFASAVENMRTAEDAWKQQLELSFGRPIELHMDYDALCGRYELIQPFIHRALVAGLGAISTLGLNPKWRGRLAGIERVVISVPEGPTGTVVQLGGSELTLRVDIGEEGPPPVEEVAGAIRSLMGGGDDEDEAVSAAASAGSEAGGGGATGDVYQQAAELVVRLEQVLREEKLWPGEPPVPLVVKGAFGSENMQYENWLAWVLIPRLKSIVVERGEFPNGSALSTYGRRAMSGVPGEDQVCGVLMEIDRLVDGLQR